MVYGCSGTVSDMYVNQGAGGSTRDKEGEGVKENEGRSLQTCQAMVHFSKQLK